MQVTLDINAPDGERQVSLGDEPLTIGRAEPASLVIADQGLSRRHATLRREAGRVFVVDENSTNGSYLNGAPVPPGGLSLSDRDELRLGNSTVINVSIKPQVAAPPVSAATATAPPAAPHTTTSGASVAAGPASTPSSSSSLSLKSVLPVVVVAVLLLAGVGFGLHLLTRGDSSDRRASEESGAAPEAGDLAARSAEDEAGAEDLPAVSSSAVETGGASSEPGATAPAAEVSILSSAPAPPPADAALDAAPAQRKLYKEMSEAEQKEFIKRRAQHVAVMMGKRPYAFTPEALTHVKFWLDAFARRVGNKRTGLWGGDTAFILERARQHAPHINRAFREHNVPVVVGLYIPFIETEYTNIASDNFAGAAGLFQFLGPTAEHYGVPRTERTDVAKMAPAAARYFRDNIMSFGDDPMSVALSIAGYNRAPESVKRDLRNVLNAPNNEDKERSFWTLIANQGKLDEYFHRENVNYVPRFFAAAIIGETPWAFGLDMRPLSTYTELPANAAAGPEDAPRAESARAR